MNLHCQKQLQFSKQYIHNLFITDEKIRWVTIYGHTEFAPAIPDSKKSSWAGTFELCKASSFTSLSNLFRSVLYSLSLASSVDFLNQNISIIQSCLEFKNLLFLFLLYHGHGRLTKLQHATHCSLRFLRLHSIHHPKKPLSSSLMWRMKC